MSMKLKEQVLFIGLGNFGCKIAKLFYEKGYKAIFANGSEQDLKLLGDIPGVYKFHNHDGFGGDRSRAVECLSEDEDFVNALQNVKEKIVFVCYAAAGSTGSGTAPFVEEILLDGDETAATSKIVCPITALPASNEAILKHQNAYQAILEQQEIEGLGASFFINNEANKADNYEWINNLFVKLLDAFLTDNSSGKINNFDTSEKVEMLKDFGMMIICRLKIDKPEQVIKTLTEESIFAPVSSKSVCDHISIVHSRNSNSDIRSSELIAQFGQPINVYEGYNGTKTMVAVSGLNYPIGHLNRMAEHAQMVYEERQRNKKLSVQKLQKLDIIGNREEDKSNKPAHKFSKLELLKQKRAQMAQK